LTYIKIINVSRETFNKEKQMKKKDTTSKYIILTGLLPFIIPILAGIYKITIESWNMVDWLILYSYIFWPSYIIGLILIIIGIIKLKR